MLFNSYEYLFGFLPLAWIGYRLATKLGFVRALWAWLVLCSLFFYGAWKPEYLPLILGSMAANYVIGRALVKLAHSESPYRLPVLILGVGLNLAALGYFKYADFVVENINQLADATLTQPQVVLPLAISFFTFQQIAFLSDCSKGAAHGRDPLRYSLFVAFFPQLIAGPIVHHSEMMPQFEQNRALTADTTILSRALFVFSIGLFKKVILADTLAMHANLGFDKLKHLDSAEAWCTSLCYTFQLYFDFSGYTDMAIGSAMLFGITLPFNFNSPYRSLNIQDFWRTWHMTLSRFLRDYVYIPLGGGRAGKFRTHTNLFITFLLGGIWHGAGWTFVTWGMLHGLAMVAHRALGRFFPSGWAWKLLAWLGTFLFVNATWVFFRAKSFKAAKKVLYGMVGLAEASENFRLKPEVRLLEVHGLEKPPGLWLLLPLLGLSLVLVLWPRNSNMLSKTFQPRWYSAIAGALMLLASIYALQTQPSDFLYFDF